jgi:thiamine biosynthesis lipoprotein
MLTAFAHPMQRRFDFALRTPRAAAPAGWVKRDDVAMGTSIHVELWADDARAGEAAVQAVFDEMHRIDRAWSPHKTGSELSRINREAGRRAVPLSEEGFRLIERALAFAELTEGAFDISYAAVGRLYDYREGRAPDAAALAAARALVGWRGLELDRRAKTLRFAREGMCIDLGGFAKGHAVDNAAALLMRRGVRHAHVSAGGDSRVIGDRRGRPWGLAIRDPRGDAAEHVAVLPLVDTAVSTSGDYERCFVTPEGERVHHLIDPASGRSAARVRSVTVLGADGLSCEALSKALFVRGPAEGLALLARVPGLDAVLVDADGRLHLSEGLQDLSR